MLDTIQVLQPIAASGTASVNITLPSGTDKLFLGVAANYAAVSATASGLSAAFKYSNDGSTFLTSAVPTLKVAPAATVVGQGFVEIGIADIATRKDPGDIVAIQVNLTNTDGSNAVTAFVNSEIL